MSIDQRHFSPIFSIDVTADQGAEQQSSQIDANELLVMLLKQLVEGQKKEMASHISGPHKARHQELMKWKEAHPELADSCRGATSLLEKVQEQFLCNLTTEIADSDETLVDSDFMLNEFIDRFGPRLHHLNGLLQVLSQLSSVANPPANAAE